jgi:hypothetical protein
MLRWDLGDGEDMTGSRRTRRSRSFDLGGQSSPAATRRRDWRSWGGRELRELDDGVDLLQLCRGKVVRERRLIKVKRIEERRETGAHQGWRISSEVLADAAEIGEQFEQLGGTILSRKGERRGRSAGAFIAFEGGAFNREITVSNHWRYRPERKEEGIAGGRRYLC